MWRCIGHQRNEWCNYQGAAARTSQVVFFPGLPSPQNAPGYIPSFPSHPSPQWTSAIGNSPSILLLVRVKIRLTFPEALKIPCRFTRIHEQVSSPKYFEFAANPSQIYQDLRTSIINPQSFNRPLHHYHHFTRPISLPQ